MSVWNEISHNTYSGFIGMKGEAHRTALIWRLYITVNHHRRLDPGGIFTLFATLFGKSVDFFVDDYFKPVCGPEIM